MSIKELTTLMDRCEVMLDWYTANEEALDAAGLDPSPDGHDRLLIYCSTRDKYATALRLLMATSDTVGEIRKDVSGNYASARLDHKGVVLYAYTHRDEVCERVQVGTETVLEPAPDAPMVEVERPVYEWRCGSVLAGAEGDAHGHQG